MNQTAQKYYCFFKNLFFIEKITKKQEEKKENAPGRIEQMRPLSREE